MVWYIIVIHSYINTMYMLQQYSSHEKTVKREIRINLEIYTFSSAYLLANSSPLAIT